MRKSQFFSIDILLAILGLLGILLYLIFTFRTVSIDLVSLQQDADLFMISEFAVATLFDTKGNPSDWHTQETIDRSSVSSLGFLNGQYISLEKVDALSTYASSSDEHFKDIKRVLGIVGPGYSFSADFYFYDNGFIKNESLQLGELLESSSLIYTVTRFFLWDNEDKLIGMAKFYFYVEDV